MNKKGQISPDSTGWSWIKMLILLFSVGFILLILTYAITDYLSPAYVSLAPLYNMNSSDTTAYLAEGTKVNSYWMFIWIIILVATIVGIIMNSIANRRNELQ